MKPERTLFSESFTGKECELCHCKEATFSPLQTFYLDRDPTNNDDSNIAHVCAPCYRHLLLAMPEGIAKSRTLFAFLINRGCYSKEQKDDYVNQCIADHKASQRQSTTSKS